MLDGLIANKYSIFSVMFWCFSDLKKREIEFKKRAETFYLDVNSDYHWHRLNLVIAPEVETSEHKKYPSCKRNGKHQKELLVAKKKYQLVWIYRCGINIRFDPKLHQHRQTYNSKISIHIISICHAETYHFIIIRKERQIVQQSISGTRFNIYVTHFLGQIVADAQPV